jgi:hypothetical protein
MPVLLKCVMVPPSIKSPLRQFLSNSIWLNFMDLSVILVGLLIGDSVIAVDIYTSFVFWN